MTLCEYKEELLKKGRGVSVESRGKHFSRSTKAAADSWVLRGIDKASERFFLITHSAGEGEAALSVNIFLLIPLTSACAWQ